MTLIIWNQPIPNQNVMDNYSLSTTRNAELSSGELMSHLIELYLPLSDNRGRRFERPKFQAVEDRLTEIFGGFTSFSRTPAGGLWKSAQDELVRDVIAVYEVLCDELDLRWWRSFKAELEESFEQDEILVRAHTVEVL